MIDSVADVARRLRRDAKKGETVRHWSGWRLALTHGPYEDAFDPDRVAFARQAANELYERVHDRPAPAGAEMDALSREAQRGLWHLSASWRGGHPVEQGRAALAELLAAVGVPEAKRDGVQYARVLTPHGTSPQVTHWVWRDEEGDRP